MRPIKFRAWQDNQMYYGVENSYDTIGRVYTTPAQQGYTEDQWQNFTHMLNEAEDVMQFTGLHDKNGVEIYEGDILQTDLGTFEVYWRVEGRWAVNQLTVVKSKVVDGTDLWAIGHLYEVIGNIHAELITRSHNRNLPLWS